MQIIQNKLRRKEAFKMHSNNLVNFDFGKKQTTKNKKIANFIGSFNGTKNGSVVPKNIMYNNQILSTKKTDAVHVQIDQTKSLNEPISNLNELTSNTFQFHTFMSHNNMTNEQFIINNDKQHSENKNTHFLLQDYFSHI